MEEVVIENDLDGVFSIVGDSTYSLGAWESKEITIRFEPSTEGSFDADVTFTGAQGPSRPISGNGVSGGG
jgi:hypothetical protein